MKKGLSTVISVLLMILLAIIIVGVVWTIINSLIKTEMRSSVCFGKTDKLALNNDYTCYDSDKKEFHFSVERGDVDIDGIVVMISNVYETKSYEIKKEAETIPGLINYDGTTSIKIPDKNAGLTYIVKKIEKPSSIKVAMIIGEQQCAISDSIEQIDDCSLLT